MDYQHLTKDRSLGYMELRLNELAEEENSEEYPYKSTGKKTEAANLKFDKGTFKGQLHYEAEFVPALALRDFKFSTGGHHMHAANGANGDVESADGNGGSVSSSDVEAEAIPAGITTRGPLGMKRKENHVKNAASTDTSYTVDVDDDADSIIESSTESEGKGKPVKGVVLSKEQLMEHRKLLLFVISQLLPLFQSPESSSSISPPPSLRGRLVSRFCWTMDTGPRLPLPWLEAAT